MTRLAWLLVVGAALSGLGLAALFAVDLISESRPWDVSPVWIPLAIAGVLLSLGFLWSGCRAMIASAFGAPRDHSGTSRAGAARDSSDGSTQ